MSQNEIYLTHTCRQNVNMKSNFHSFPHFFKGRLYAAAAPTRQNEWLVTGGYNGDYLASTDAYSEGSFTIGVIPELEGVDLHCLVRVSDEEVMLVGGEDYCKAAPSFYKRKKIRNLKKIFRELQ